MGDPAGIGPEIVVDALQDQALFEKCAPLVIGDSRLLEKIRIGKGASNGFYQDSEEASREGRVIPVEGSNELAESFPIGTESAVCGKASGEYIEQAVDLWKSGRIDAIVTAPINKKALNLGGYDFPGHTEFLAHLTDTKEYAMSFFAGSLCVVLLSTHISLKNAIDYVNRERLSRLIRFTSEKLSDLLNKDVRLAVAGLNPHASEGGLFGNEEEKEMIPAVEKCRQEYDIDVSGPFSADTVFLRGYKGEFDGIISCYHDQATIAVKCLSFGAAANVTLGLPFIRTSVDHGTGYDIARKNLADSSSLTTAINLATDFIRIRKNS